MTRFMVLRTDTHEDQNPVVPIEGHVKVEGGALVFRHQHDDIDPFCIIGPGCWSDVWTDQAKEGR